MAVTNTLAPAPQDAQTLSVKYNSSGETVWLTPMIVKKYLVSGDADRITDQEIALYIKLCQYQRLNPFLREAHCIKYGDAPATMVTGKSAFEKRAQRNEKYHGNQAGVIILSEKGIENRIGSLVMSKHGEELVGGWAKVFVDGYTEPVEITVSFDEYVGRKKTGEINSQWATKPATMIRKVALVQALREAFPEDFAGMYSQEEMGIDGAILSDMPVEIPSEEPKVITEPEAGNDPLAE